MYMYYNSAITETEQGRSLEYKRLWVKGAYRNEGAYSVGALIDKNKFEWGTY